MLVLEQLLNNHKSQRFIQKFYFSFIAAYVFKKKLNIKFFLYCNI